MGSRFSVKWSTPILRENLDTKFPSSGEPVAWPPRSLYAPPLLTGWHEKPFFDQCRWFAKSPLTDPWNMLDSIPLIIFLNVGEEEKILRTNTFGHRENKLPFTTILYEIMDTTIYSTKTIFFYTRNWCEIQAHFTLMELLRYRSNHFITFAVIKYNLYSLNITTFTVANT